MAALKPTSRRTLFNYQKVEPGPVEGFDQSLTVNTSIYPGSVARSRPLRPTATRAAVLPSGVVANALLRFQLPHTFWPLQGLSGFLYSP